MHRKDAIAWVVSVCSVSLRLSQAKTLAILVAAAMRVQRVSLANIGRMMDGHVKHQIKRCWRFCANERVETADAMRGIVAKLLKKRSKKKKLLIALDWVDIKGFQTLVASMVLKGRSTPIAWASTTNHIYEGHRSRNAFEESLLLVLRDMIPQKIKVVILADRGFGRTALATFCQRQGFGYLIRIQPKVTVRLHGFHGKLLDYPVYKGIAKVLKRVSYRSDEAVTQNVVVHWRKNLPQKRDECWFLMTDQKGSAHQLCRLYGQRMTIEQLFRDDKSKRNGWSLRDTKITQPDPTRPPAVDPRHRLSASVRHRTDRQARVHSVGLVLDQPRQRVQHLHHRPDYARQNPRQSARSFCRRPSTVRIGLTKLGMTQIPAALTTSGLSPQSSLQNLR
jgi:hypothetical protein